jgi:hypothetical protein
LVQGRTGPWTWAAGPGVKTIAGIISATGTVDNGSGFTASQTGTGAYTITFPAGTWNGTTAPVMTITPFGINGGVVDPVVLSLGYTANGSATFNIILSNTTPGETNQNNAFMFIAAQS